MDVTREITREEAIANLKMISVAFVEPVTKEQRKLIDDTFDMAIKALEQEPSDTVKLETYKQVAWERDIAISQLKELGYEFGEKIESCDDAISRQAVLEMAYDMSEIDGEHFTEPCMVVDVEDIQKLPPVNPQPKTGHWIKKEDDTCWWYVCSECEQEPLKNRWNDDDVLSKYCPNCGAKMESDKNE